MASWFMDDLAQDAPPLTSPPRASPAHGPRPIAADLATCPRRRLLPILCAPVVALGRATSARAQPPPVEDWYAQTALLHTLINAARQERGVEPLARSVGLDQAAQAHTLDMAEHDFVGHASSDGADPFTRIRRFYPYDTWLGETLGAGVASPEEVVAMWLASDGHRAIMLGPDFRALGLACMRRDGTTYQWYWTADFGGERDVH